MAKKNVMLVLSNVVEGKEEDFNHWYSDVHLADGLKGVTGVVEHGLFLDLAEEAILGTDTGVDILFP